MSVAKFVSTGAAALGVLVMVGSAQAADLYGGYKDQPYYPPPPVFPIWEGFYAGANFGGAWSQVDAASNVVFLGGSAGTIIGNRTLSSSDSFGGVQAGYNFQSGNGVFGVEFDLGGMGLGASGTFVDTSNPLRVLRVSGSSGWYGDLTGRAGYAVSNALFYAKGGFAFLTGDVQIADSFDNINQHSGTFTGWTIGGGIEYALNPSWTIKGEYMYFDFGNNNLSCCSGSSSGQLDDSLSVNTVKLGFNYLMHSRYIPLN